MEETLSTVLDKHNDIISAAFYSSTVLKGLLGAFLVETRGADVSSSMGRLIRTEAYYDLSHGDLLPTPSIRHKHFRETVFALSENDYYKFIVPVKTNHRGGPLGGASDTSEFGYMNKVDDYDILMLCS